LALLVRIKPRAVGEIHRAAQWWSESRPAAPGAIEADLKDALALLVEHSGIGSKVDNSRDPETRRFLLDRTRYFVYYRPKGRILEVLAFWHTSREHEPRV
jgi:plasmid stabilization system protein ParE